MQSKNNNSTVVRVTSKSASASFVRPKMRRSARGTTKKASTIAGLLLGIMMWQRELVEDQKGKPVKYFSEDLDQNVGSSFAANPAARRGGFCGGHVLLLRLYCVRAIGED